MTPEERAVIEAAETVAKVYGCGILGHNLVGAVEALRVSRARYRVENSGGVAPWCVMTPDDEKCVVGEIFCRCYREADARRVAEALNRG